MKLENKDQVHIGVKDEALIGESSIKKQEERYSIQNPFIESLNEQMVLII